MSRLYTYLPKDNTALTEGLLSTALSDKGFEKYRGRTGKHRKEDVLKVLDSWEPEWTRSKAISALTEPIPPDAADEFLEFAKNRKLYSFSTKDLIKANILAHLRRARKGGGTDPVDDVKKERLNWHRKKKHLLFQGVPHYFVETTGGRIPPEFVREEKKASQAPGLTEKRAQSSPLNRLKFSAIRRWIKAMRGMNRKDIRDFANSEDVIKSLPVYRGDLGDPGFRKTVFPRRSLFRGSLGFLSGGGQTGDGLLAEELGHLPKMLWQNATPVPNYAVGYGDVLSVYNARKLPGVLSGRRRIAGDRMMFGFLKDGDPTKPVDSMLFKSWYERPKRMRMLDSHSVDFNAINASEHGQIETLVDSIKERPQRVYKRRYVSYDPVSNSRIADFYDVTPLERFYRAIPDSPTAAIDRENLQHLVRFIGRGGA